MLSKECGWLIYEKSPLFVLSLVKKKFDFSFGLEKKHQKLYLEMLALQIALRRSFFSDHLNRINIEIIKFFGKEKNGYFSSNFWFGPLLQFRVSKVAITFSMKFVFLCL